MNFLARVIAWGLILQFVGAVVAVLAGVFLGLSGGAQQ